MPDVALFNVPLGAATFTATPTGGDTVTKPSARRWCLGPPIKGASFSAGLFELQVPSTDTGQTANTYRWTEDVPYNAASPTAYTYFGNAFVSIGGL